MDARIRGFAPNFDATSRKLYTNVANIRCSGHLRRRLRVRQQPNGVRLRPRPGVPRGRTRIRPRRRGPSTRLNLPDTQPLNPVSRRKRTGHHGPVRLLRQADIRLTPRDRRGHRPQDHRDRVSRAANTATIPALATLKSKPDAERRKKERKKERKMRSYYFCCCSRLLFRFCCVIYLYSLPMILLFHFTIVNSDRVIDVRRKKERKKERKDSFWFGTNSVPPPYYMYSPVWRPASWPGSAPAWATRGTSCPETGVSDVRQRPMDAHLVL